MVALWSLRRHRQELSKFAGTFNDNINSRFARFARVFFIVCTFSEVRATRVAFNQSYRRHLQMTTATATPQGNIMIGWMKEKDLAARRHAFLFCPLQNNKVN